MGFTVGDCCNVTRLLSFVAGMPQGDGSQVSPTEALEAAMALAKQAHKALGAGINTNEMKRRWPKVNMGQIKLTTLLRMLGEYQGRLESEIDTHLIPGTAKTSCDADARIVSDARRKWNEVEQFVMLLVAKPARKAKKAAKQ